MNRSVLDNWLYNRVMLQLLLIAGTMRKQVDHTVISMYKYIGKTLGMRFFEEFNPKGMMRSWCYDVIPEGFKPPKNLVPSVSNSCSENGNGKFCHQSVCF